MPQKIPILTYHSVDESGSVISTSPGLFRRQMEFFKNSGYRSLPLKEAVNTIASRGVFPERCFVITFDDGYENVFTGALPVLRDLGFSATVFLITDYCGKTNRWPGQNPAIPELPLADWEQIRAMKEKGFEFGAHTRTHPDLTKIPARDAEQEIVSSKLKIEEALGMPAITFAYPYGRLNPEIKAIAARHFAGACSTRLAKATPDADPCDIPRVDTFYLSSETAFTRISGRAFDFYLFARNCLREFKSRFLTSS